MNEEIATGQDPAVRDKVNSEHSSDGAQGMPTVNGGSGGAVNARNPNFVGNFVGNFVDKVDDKDAVQMRRISLRNVPTGGNGEN